MEVIETKLQDMLSPVPVYFAQLMINLAKSRRKALEERVKVLEEKVIAYEAIIHTTGLQLHSLLKEEKPNEQ